MLIRFLFLLLICLYSSPIQATAIHQDGAIAWHVITDNQINDFFARHSIELTNHYYYENLLNLGKEKIHEVFTAHQNYADARSNDFVNQLLKNFFPYDYENYDFFPILEKFKKIGDKGVQSYSYDAKQEIMNELQLIIACALQHKIEKKEYGIQLSIIIKDDTAKRRITFLGITHRSSLDAEQILQIRFMNILINISSPCVIV